jgi:hypothetical protein
VALVAGGTVFIAATEGAEAGAVAFAGATAPEDFAPNQSFTPVQADFVVYSSLVGMTSCLPA